MFYFTINKKIHISLQALAQILTLFTKIPTSLYQSQYKVKVGRFIEWLAGREPDGLNGC
jgi:hypothetical protein